MQYTFFHWALTPWCLYGMVGLVLGYFCLRKKRPNLISEAFRTLLGNRVDGPLGKCIDVFAIWATLFGSATSLGFGAAQTPTLAVRAEVAIRLAPERRVSSRGREARLAIRDGRCRWDVRCSPRLR
jgi:hypothetical protein